MGNQESINQLKDWLRQAFAWDVAHRQNLLRIASAKGLGLSQDLADRPFPGSPLTLVTSSSPEGKTMPQNPWGKRFLIGLSLASMLTAGGAGLLALHKQPAPKEPSRPSQPSQPMPKNQEQEFEFQWELIPETGEMKVSPPKRVK